MVRSSWLAVLCLGLLSGCASMPQPASPITEARLAIERTSLTSGDLHAIRAEARVDQRGERGRVKGTVLMFVERTPRVRFDVMSQFGPIAILTSDAQRFAFADLRESRFLTGITCPRNIARLLGVPLSVEDTARFLLAGTPEFTTDDAHVTWHEDGFYRVTLRGKDGRRQELDLAVYPADVSRLAAEQRLYLLRSEIYAANGGTELRVTYDDHQPVRYTGGTLLLPYRVRVEQPKSETDTMIRFKDITLNPTIAPGVFEQTARPGMQVEEATCD